MTTTTKMPKATARSDEGFVFVLKGVNARDVGRDYGMQRRINKIIPQRTYAPEGIDESTTDGGTVDKPNTQQVVSVASLGMVSRGPRSDPLDVYLDAYKNRIRVYGTMAQFHRIDGSAIKYPDMTHCRCWWDHHTFETEPIGIPISHKKNPERFECSGFFCGYPCALAFLNEHPRHTHFAESRPLLNHMYRLDNGVNAPSLESAPHWTLLEDYGGTLSLEEFRNVSGRRVIFKEVANIRRPMKFPVNVMFEEKTRL